MRADQVQDPNNTSAPYRFCQQCTRLEPLSRFDEGRRSCRTSLCRRRSRKRPGSSPGPASRRGPAAAKRTTSSGDSSASQSGQNDTCAGMSLSGAATAQPQQRRRFLEDSGSLRSSKSEQLTSGMMLGGSGNAVQGWAGMPISRLLQQLLGAQQGQDSPGTVSAPGQPAHPRRLPQQPATAAQVAPALGVATSLGLPLSASASLSPRASAFPAAQSMPILPSATTTAGSLLANNPTLTAGLQLIISLMGGQDRRRGAANQPAQSLTAALAQTLAPGGGTTAARIPAAGVPSPGRPQAEGLGLEIRQQLQTMHQLQSVKAQLGQQLQSLLMGSSAAAPGQALSPQQGQEQLVMAPPQPPSLTAQQAQPQPQAQPPPSLRQAWQQQVVGRRETDVEPAALQQQLLQALLAAAQVPAPE